jgi:hypothetical protein
VIGVLLPIGDAAATIALTVLANLALLAAARADR